MIFVTVGSQTPFDRLIRAVDAWAGIRAKAGVFAQVGESNICPRNMKHAQFLTPAQFEQTVRESSAVVSHAGTGTIISALVHEKPILVLPRRASLGETRNEHQLATARRFLEMGKIHVAFDEHELAEKLDHIELLRASTPIAPSASPRLIAAVQKFVDGI